MLKATMYDWGGVNVWVFHLINDWRGNVLDRVMWLGTQISDHRNFAVYMTIAALAAVVAAVRESRSPLPVNQTAAYRWLVTLAVFCVAYFADGLLLTLTKPWFDLPRPPLALPAGAVHIIGEAEFHHSLPSGHAAFAVTFVASLWPMLRLGWRWLAVLFVCWVSLSRVNVGAHFPADIVASILTALPIVLIVRLCLNGFGRSFEAREYEISDLPSDFRAPSGGVQAANFGSDWSFSHAA